MYVDIPQAIHWCEANSTFGSCSCKLSNLAVFSYVNRFLARNPKIFII